MNKPDGISRSVRVKKHERAAGDAPTLDHVGRMPGMGKKKRRRRVRKGAVNRRYRLKIARAWTLLIGFFVLVLLGLAVWGGMYWQSLQRKKDTVTIALLPPAPPEVVKPSVPSPTEEEALALAKKALADREPAAVGNSFRTGESSLLEISDYLKDLETRDGPVERLEWLGNMDVNDSQMEGVIVSFKTVDGRGRNRLMLFTPDEEAKWKVDFDAFARTVTPSWDDFLHHQAGIARVRVYLSRENYHNGVFRDEDRWKCYGIASPDTREVLMGYCEKGSACAAAMDWIFIKGVDPVRVTVEIKRVEGSEPRQFQITKVLAEDWVISGRQFDSRFGE